MVIADVFLNQDISFLLRVEASLALGHSEHMTGLNAHDYDYISKRWFFVALYHRGESDNLALIPWKHGNLVNLEKRF